MSKGIFITGTGTDVGKTYITALIIKKLRKEGINCGYYKAAISGAESVKESDAGFVNEFANIHQDEKTMLSYIYKTPVSPHLAAQIEGNPVCLRKVKKDFLQVQENYEYVVVEGSGGIICPIRWDEEEHIMLLDIVKALNVPVVIVADAGLGTINSTVLTIEYLKGNNIKIKGVILNNYVGDKMQIDNMGMIEELTSIPVIATAKKNGDCLEVIDECILTAIKQK